MNPTSFIRASLLMLIFSIFSESCLVNNNNNNNNNNNPKFTKFGTVW